VICAEKNSRKPRTSLQ